MVEILFLIKLLTVESWCNYRNLFKKEILFSAGELKNTTNAFETLIAAIVQPASREYSTHFKHH